MARKTTKTTAKSASSASNAFIEARRVDCEEELKSSEDWLGRWWQDTDAFLENWLGNKANAEAEIKEKGYEMAVRELVATVRSINLRAKAGIMVLDDIAKGRTAFDGKTAFPMLQFEALVDKKARVMGGWL